MTSNGDNYWKRKHDVFAEVVLIVCCVGPSLLLFIIVLQCTVRISRDEERTHKKSNGVMSHCSLARMKKLLRVPGTILD